jgi:hypothetical protein
MIIPNPSAGKFRLIMNTDAGNMKVTIYNLLGVKVYDGLFEPAARFDMEKEIDISSQPKGIYILLVTGDKVSGSQKVIIH